MTEQKKSEKSTTNSDVLVPPPIPPVIHIPSKNTAPKQDNHESSVNGLAISAFVIGLIAFISGFTPIWGILVGSVAVILGVLALQRPTLRPLSIIGIVAGGIGLLASLLFSLALIIGTLVSDTDTTFQTNNKNTHQISLMGIFHNFGTPQSTILEPM